jgi:hypothetical protein
MSEHPPGCPIGRVPESALSHGYQLPCLCYTAPEENLPRQTAEEIRKEIKRLQQRIRMEDPEYAARKHEADRKHKEYLRERYASDPEFAEKKRAMRRARYAKGRALLGKTVDTRFKPKDKCPAGHTREEENLVHWGGKRRCKACAYEVARKYQRQNRAMISAYRRMMREQQREANAS